SYPYEWIQTLDIAEKLDFDQVLGGHGDVMKNKEKFELWKEYFGDLMDQTAQVYSQGATVGEGEKKVSQWLVGKYATKVDPAFSQSVGANVVKAYQVVAQR